jgi:MFS family permease
MVSGARDAGVAGSRLGGRYKRLWAATTISNLGDGMSVTALPLLAATLTRDPFLVALLHFAQFAPWLLFSLVSGVLVDRWDRRHVMWRVDLFRAGVIGALGLLVAGDRAGLPLLFVAAFLLGTAETLFDNASQALLPSLVERRHLARANGRLFGAQIVTNQFAGPAVGAVLFAVTAASPFLVDAGSYVAAAVLVALIPGVYRPGRQSSGARGESPESPGSTGSTGWPAAAGNGPRAMVTGIRRDIADGLRWLWGHRVLRSLALVLGAINLLAEGALAVMVLYAQDILGLGDIGYGLLMTSFAVGSLAASLVGERAVARLGSGQALVLSLVVMGAGQLAIGLSADAVVVAVLTMGVGFATIVWNIITVSLRQALIPDEILGRVNSAYRFIGWGAIPIGALAGGVLADHFGLRAPFVVAGLGTILTAVVMSPVVNPGSMAATEREAAARTDRVPVTT